MNNTYNYYELDGLKEDFDLDLFLIDYMGAEIADDFTHVYCINKKLWYGENALQNLRIVMPFMYKNNQIKIIDKK